MARLWRCREPECLAAGPAGTGKTRGLLELCHLRALKYAGSRSLITRKERATLTQTALVTWDREVCPGLDGVRWCASDLEYRYPNGSAVVVAGLDREGRKVMSGQYDFVYVNEATELSEAEWEVLTTRLRNAAAPYQQVAGDCNPDSPSHWLKRRCDSGRTLLFEVRHRDNPTLWQGNAWTPRGADYLSKLDALTGARRLRLREGRWVQAEGVVYEGWDAGLHVIDPFPVPASWPRLWSVDFGYTHPFCYDGETEVLTPLGWHRFDSLEQGAPVATLNPQSRVLEFQVPVAYICHPFDGEMVVGDAEHEGAHFCVTPDHQMVVENRKTRQWSKVRADRLPGGTSIPTGWASVSEGEPDIPFELPRQVGPHRLRLPPTTRRAFAEFLGLVIAEGYLKCNRDGHSKYIRISQKRDVEGVRGVLSRLGWKWSEGHNRATGCLDFCISSADLYDFLHGHGCAVRSHLKRIPGFVLGWGAACLRALLAGLQIGDGSPACRRPGPRGVDVNCGARYHTTSRELADDVQALACLLGLATRLSTATRSGGYANPATDEIYTVRFHSRKRAAVEKLTLTRLPYRGPVYCVTVPNGVLVVRRKGRPMACGNCCGWWARDPDGRLYLYREVYHTQRLVEDHARHMARLSAGEPRPVAVVCDHDAEDRATLERHLRLLTTPARKEVSPGIQAVAARLRPAGDGRPRLFLMRGALVERDAALAEAKKPTRTAEEVDSYVWNLTGGRRRGEEPVKALDDGMDQMRYAVAFFDLAPRGGRAASAGGRPAPAGSPYLGASAYGPRGGSGYGPRG